MFGKQALYSSITVALLMLVALAGTPIAAQEATRDNALSEEEQVTAIDLVVELSKDGETAVDPPRDLSPRDFRIEEDGRSLAVVGIDAPPSSEAWRLIIYFDHELSTPASIRWAASALADRALALAQLGEVQIVVADPDPRLVLGPSSDAVLIDQMLSGLFLESVRGNELMALREEFLLEREDNEELRTPVAVNALAAEEVRLVGLYQDAVLATLIQDPPGTARRALLLVSDGFDRRPEEFYGEYAEVDGEIAGALNSATEEWLEAVAAYGWSVISIQAPEEVKDRAWGVTPAQNPRAVSFKTPALAARLEGTLDPEKAAAHHELGQRLAEQGSLEEAEDAFNEALRYYHDHKKYSRQRAAVLIDLGEALRGLDRADEARRSIRQAVNLDGELAARHPFVNARLDSPTEPLDRLADLTGGHAAKNEQELSAAIAALAKRVRLTFQFQGAPDGQSHEIDVGLVGRDLDVRSPAWVRFGTPPAVLAWRARRLLAGEVESGELAVKCRFVAGPRTYSSRTGTLDIEMRDPRDEGATDSELRLTVGLAAEEGPYEIRQMTAVPVDGAYSVPLELDDTDVFLSLVVEDPASGRWGGATVELQ